MSTPLKHGVESVTPIQQLTTENVAEFLRKHPELLKQLSEALPATEEVNPTTPDRVSAEEKAEREKEESEQEPKLDPEDKDEEPPIDLDDPYILPLQGSYKYQISKSASRVFSRLHKTDVFYQRGGSVVRATKEGLEQETSQSLRTTVESYFNKILLINNKPFNQPGITAKAGTLSNDLAQAILASDSISHLREINTVSNCPVLVVKDGKLDPHKKGYAKSRNGGGVYVLGGKSTVPVTIEEAVKIVLEPFDQFDFVDEPDRTRAIAMAITPAMVQAGLIDGHTPIDLAEADQSQAGKGYRHDIVTAIYNESPTLVTNRRNGVGSLDESISNAILKGKPFIRLDNLRENLDSEVLESYITTPPTGTTSVRGFRRHGDVKGGQHIFQASSNGIQLTQDAANRAVIIRIRKRPDGYKFRKYNEGYILDHVRANYARFLGAIHKIVIEWYAQGRQESEGVSHDFRRWAAKLDWIMANLFGRSDMLKGHRELQNRISDDALTTLRHIAVELDRQGKLEYEVPFTTAELVEALEESGVEVKGADVEAKAKTLGVKLGKAFKKVENNTSVWVDGYTVERGEKPVKYAKVTKPQKVYFFSKQVTNAEEDKE
jgi:hypothetical protein